MNLSISDSTIEELTLPATPPTALTIIKTVIGSVLRVASATGLPEWVEDCSVDRFQAMGTVAQIKDAELSPAHLILVTVLKKTFFQKGGGRKEEALLRGLGTVANAKVADRVIKLLISEDIILKRTGDQGNIYIPVRAETRRMKATMSELSLSKDTLWLAVGKFN